MKEKTKVVCQRCGKVLLELEEMPNHLIVVPSHMIKIGGKIYFVCEDCYMEYVKLKNELYEYIDKKLEEWFEKGKKKEKNDHKKSNS